MMNRNNAFQNGDDIFKPAAIRTLEIGWILIIAFSGAWMAAWSPWFLELQERRLYDTVHGYFQETTPPLSMLRVVAGERTLQREGLPARETIARLLDQLKNARLVLLDMPFDAPGNPKEDAALIRAVREHGKVLGQTRLFRTAGGDIPIGPFPELREVLLRVGFSDPDRDPDGVTRRGVWGYKNPNGRFTPSLAQAALEEMSGQTFSFIERYGEGRALLPWKTLQLSLSRKNLLTFWLGHPQSSVPVCEYTDVLDGTLPYLTPNKTVVIISPPETSLSGNILVTGGKSITRSEYVLCSLSSLANSFAPVCLSSAWRAIIVFFAAAFFALLGFLRLRASFIIILICIPTCLIIAVVLFVKAGIAIPAPSLFWACAAGYFGSRFMSARRRYSDLFREWHVRSLSIQPLLALASQPELAGDTKTGFDEYLRSLWNGIEEKTGVMLYSTRVSENFSLIRDYLTRAWRNSDSDQDLGQENFIILRNAAESSPRHRMLVPLPRWNESGSFRREPVGAREYVILAWERPIPAETLTSLAALTLFAAVHFHGLEESRRRKDMLYKTIEAIMMAVEARDLTTSQHSRRVAALSKQLAQWMKLQPQEVDDIYFAASIHDIGKLGIPDSILNKPGALDAKEIAEMHRHPLLGEDIMRPVELSAYIVSGILQHHESYDGSGYPYGLKGPQLTNPGKIIKVADVFDALMNRRQYKEPWTEAKVREFLLERRGTEFDPQVVDIFLRHISDVSDNPLLYYGIRF